MVGYQNGALGCASATDDWLRPAPWQEIDSLISVGLGVTEYYIQQKKMNHYTQPLLNCLFVVVGYNYSLLLNIISHH